MHAFWKRRKAAAAPDPAEVAEPGAELVRFRYPGGRPAVRRELLADRLGRGDVLTPDELGADYARQQDELTRDAYRLRAAGWRPRRGQ